VTAGPALATRRSNWEYLQGTLAFIEANGQPPEGLVRMRDQMSLRELKVLLDQVPDTRELVLRREASRGPAWNVVYDAWSDAHEEAECAWRTWRFGGSREAYSAYRAAADREDAAQDAVAAAGR
jgi:hypothetical protein